MNLPLIIYNVLLTAFTVYTIYWFTRKTPPKVVKTTSVKLSNSYEARKLITTGELGFNFKEVEQNIFEAKTKMSLLSFGEVIRLELVEDNVLHITSFFRHTKQFIDWNINRNNINLIVNKIGQHGILAPPKGGGYEEKTT